MFPRLLVPLDGSPIAAQAIPYAITLAHAFHSHVVLLSVLETAPDWSSMPRAAAQEADERARALAMAYLGDVTDRLHGDGLVVSADVKQGNPAATILAAAEERDCSLIVMATHGRSGINRLRLGSVAQHTVRHAPIPVLVVRADEQAPSEGAADILMNDNYPLPVARMRPAASCSHHPAPTMTLEGGRHEDRRGGPHHDSRTCQRKDPGTGRRTGGDERAHGPDV